jgi:hypothetical protein
VSFEQFQRAKDKTEAREQYFADLKRKFEDIQKNVGSQISHPALPFLVSSSQRASNVNTSMAKR